jgi:hypothetical protein
VGAVALGAAVACVVACAVALGCVAAVALGGAAVAAVVGVAWLAGVGVAADGDPQPTTIAATSTVAVAKRLPICPLLLFEIG